MHPSNGRCDLHIHSTHSDSDADIESIFQSASHIQLRCIAITDHDTISGVIAAEPLSVRFGIELINAIEFSAQHKDSEVHILGYFIDPRNPRLARELSSIRELRTERLLWMANKLKALGFGVDAHELFSRIGKTIPTRLHLAMYMLEKGLIGSLREAFQKYLAPGRPAYRSRFKHSVKETVEIIKGCGGLCFIAHPHMIAQQSWIDDFIAVGIDGLELVYPGMTDSLSSLYGNLVMKYNLLRSGGSDAHGSYKEFTQIGGVSIPYEWVQQMKNRLAGVKPNA